MSSQRHHDDQGRLTIYGIIHALGGGVAVSKEIGITSAAVSNWSSLRAAKQRIPTEYVLGLAAMAKKSKDKEVRKITANVILQACTPDKENT